MGVDFQRTTPAPKQFDILGYILNYSIYELLSVVDQNKIQVMQYFRVYCASLYYYLIAFKDEYLEPTFCFSDITCILY